MVNDAQLELIFDHIMHLATEGEALSSDDRRTYFKKYAIATLGLDTGHNFVLIYNGMQETLGPLAMWGRKIVFYEDTKDNCQEIVVRGRKERVPMRELWLALRDSLYEPMSKALTFALSHSAEMPKHESGAYGFTPEQDMQ